MQTGNTRLAAGRTAQRRMQGFCAGYGQMAHFIKAGVGKNLKKLKVQYRGKEYRRLQIQEIAVMVFLLEGRIGCSAVVAYMHLIDRIIVPGKDMHKFMCRSVEQQQQEKRYRCKDISGTLQHG